MNRFRSAVLRRCKSLSRVAVGARPSPAPYTNLRSMSTRDAAAAAAAVDADDDGAAASGGAVVLVGSSRRRYVISAEHLSHPLIAALIGDEGRQRWEGEPAAAAVVNCEVVLFDHLLWMLDNADNDDLRTDDGAAMRELAQLYAC